MLVYMSIVYCIGYFGLQYAYVWSDRKLKKIDRYLMLFFFAALIYVGYHLIPSKSDDLYRHYGVVNWHRNGQQKIDVRKNILPLAGTEQLYVYQLICWIISLQDENAYLQVVYLAIDFVCVYRIISLFAGRVDLNRKITAFYVLVYFTLMPFFNSYSGLRFSAVCHIIGLKEYKYYCENGSLLKLIFWYIICILMHPAAGIYLMIQIWYECTKNRKYFFLIIGLWGTSIKTIAVLLRNIPVSQIQYAGQKLYFYFNTYETTADKRKLIAQIAFLLFVIIMSLADAINKKKMEHSLTRFYIIIALLGLGSMNIMFIDRMVMMVGPISLIFLYNICRRSCCRGILYFGLVVWSIVMNVYYTITIFTYLRLAL